MERLTLSHLGHIAGKCHLFLPQVTIGAAICLLTACVTPLRTTQDQLCQQQAGEYCHYFGPQTSYLRQADQQLLTAQAENISLNLSQVQSISATFSDTAALDAQLSVGDKLRVGILNGEDFSADVEIDANGQIYLPYLPPINAQGLTIATLKQRISQTLVSEQLMQASSVRVNISPIAWAPIEVTVLGSVFEPGQHFINQKSDTEIKDDDKSHSGDQASDRTIAAALRASGGVRPDADIRQVRVIRGQQHFLLDLSGVISGTQVPRFLLSAGDQIFVPSSRHFEDKLVRPSQITAPGIRVFISNLTQPASSNSQSAVDTEATRFPYGTRLLTGAIAANCVGGAQSTNASRHVLLVTRNPLSDQTDIVERSLDSLIRDSWQPQMNPVLLPGDGIACYDSGVTNVREIARSLTDLLVPASLLGLL
ncbi:polysaccharide biosynthesis/export family protein [Shewanella mangrovisoli]|uniref:Polysaccharide biosynthesis/export family protein n=1 Tax=Shewanella mangrovisoli TaxID=2864211 RepID=A0ABV4VKF8_9GAMM